MANIELKYQIPTYLIIGVVVFLLGKFLLPAVDYVRFDGYVEEVAEYRSSQDPSPPDPWRVRELIQIRARHLGIPLKEKDLSVESINGLAISYSYSQPVNLYITSFQLNFSNKHGTP